MAFQIPRLQYNNLSITGDTTAASATITNVSDTSDVVIGMFIRGTNIPTGATVYSKTTSTIVLTSPLVASGNGNTIALSLGHEILFDYPPIEPTGENFDTKATTNESLSGIQQVSVNYIEATRKLNFSFMSPAIYTLMDTFMRTWALLGYDFRYFEDQSSSSYVTYELDKLSYSPKKIAPRSATTYVWELPLSFRRVV